MKKIKTNLISGSLGAGKTTLVRQLLSQKPEHEKWMLLVNEFGSVGIDGAILESAGQTEIELVPGGCICCTAKGELFDTLKKIGNNSSIERLIIEPTGLGEPDAIVDLFNSSDLMPLFEVYALFSVIDLSNTSINDLKTMTIMQSLLTMADILVLNKSDLATASKKSEILSYCQNIYPPKDHIITTSHSKLDARFLNEPHFKKTTFKFTPPLNSGNASDKPSLIYQSTNVIPHKHSKPQNLKIDTGITLPGILERKTHSDLDTQSLGWVFSPDTEFHWPKLMQLFESFSNDPEVKRAKGVFKVANPWMLFQYVNNQATREFIAYRKDSRLELLLIENNHFNLVKFEQALVESIKP